MSDTTNLDRATLYRKIATVTAAVSRIPKNGRNSFHNYNYATESDITDGLRDLLSEHGLAFLPPSVISWERSDTVKKNGERGDDLTRVQLQFGLACTDTGEVFSAFFWGEGQDGGDKGFYKAYTGAVKYFLMKTFLIATGDDPERDDGALVKTTQRPAAAPQKPQERPQATPAVETMRAAPNHPTNGSGAMGELRSELARLRTLAANARPKIVFNPPKSPADMSDLELRAAIDQLTQALEAVPA